MLDIQAGAQSPPHPNRPIEFVTIQLMPLAEGDLSVSLTATTVDETEPQLLDQEIARDRVATIDEVLSLIRAHVRVSPRPGPPATLS